MTATTDDILIACVDVDYRSTEAVAASLWFRGWAAATSECHVVAFLPQAADYEPGAFYRRELPCLLEVLRQGPRPDIIVVDGYVWLGEGAAGLGAHLQDAVGGIVVGVAKTKFVGATDTIAVCRGGSRVPLYVSAAGMPVAQAAENLVSMHGPYRVPTLLRQVDTLARNSKSDA